MALNWDFDTDKVGHCWMELQPGKPLEKINLYSGNALLIALYEHDGYYNLVWFASDLDHLKNMLGITKGYDNVMAHFGIKSLHLKASYRHTNKILSAFLKAGTPFDLHIISGE